MRAESGLVDLHCHGAVGAEFGGDVDGSRRAAAYHHDAGTGRIVASLVSAPRHELRERVAVLAPLVADGTLAGIHVEGPFLAAARRGAHDPAALARPDTDLVHLLAETAAAAGAESALVQWTFAPELDGADRLVEALAAHRIRPAIGHTDADAAQVERMIGLVGERTGRQAMVTHLFNGMPPLHHRAGGPVAAALSAAARGDALVELIADGVHVAPEMVRLVFDVVGAEQIALVSDATPATGLGDGEYRLGGVVVVVRGGVARLAAGGPIAGSTATLADCLNWTVEVARVDPADALIAATRTPAQVLDAR